MNTINNKQPSTILLDELTSHEIDDAASITSFVIVAIIALLVIGGLLVAMYGFPTFRGSASAQPALKLASVAAMPIDELPALVPPRTSGFSAQYNAQ